MSTYERDTATAAIREEARRLLAMLDSAVQQLGPTLDLDRRVELGGWVCEGRRLLHADEAPPATAAAPANVRRLVLVGKEGPAFGARAGVEVAVGRGGLRSGALDLPADGWSTGEPRK